MTALAGRVRRLDRAGRLDLPPIGSGRTAERWAALADLARHDVSEARIAEAHVDARQILAEAGREPAPSALYAVWASEHPRWALTATVDADGDLHLRGAKAFCTGVGIVDRALVTVTPLPDGPADASAPLLVDLDLGPIGPDRVDRSGWATPALADTGTAVVDLDGLVVAADRVVGGEGWYLDRPGFWDGAVGPAACWAGAALGLVDHALAHAPADPHAQAHLGALAALGWSLATVLDGAGRETDAEALADASAPTAPARSARVTSSRVRALTVRHLVDAAAAEVQDRFARALGPRPLVSEPAVIARDHALSIYRRQCHGERDLAALGALCADRPGPSTDKTDETDGEDGLDDDRR